MKEFFMPMQETIASDLIAMVLKICRWWNISKFPLELRLQWKFNERLELTPLKYKIILENSLYYTNNEVRLYKLLRQDTVGSNFSAEPCKDEGKKTYYISGALLRSPAYI